MKLDLRLLSARQSLGVEGPGLIDCPVSLSLSDGIELALVCSC